MHTVVTQYQSHKTILSASNKFDAKRCCFLDLEANENEHLSTTMFFIFFEATLKNRLIKFVIKMVDKVGDKV